MLHSLQRPPPCASGLPLILDALDMVPHHVLDDNFWAPLDGQAITAGGAPGVSADARSPPDGVDALHQAIEARGSFRLACRQSQQLSNLLIASATYDLAHMLGATPSADSAAEADRWRAEERFQAFLRRLPRLSALTLKGWASEADLVAALWQCGGATHSRVTQLTLRPELGANSHLSQSGVRAVRLAFPALRHLDVSSGTAPVGTLFVPLHAGFDNLTQFTFQSAGDVDASLLRSLAGLSRLQHLSLRLGRLAGGVAQLPITGLVNLRHCDVQFKRGAYFDLSAAAALLVSTQLTALRLWPLVASSHPAGPSSPLSIGQARFAALTSLRSLDLGSTFFIDDRASAVVHTFTLLTSLCVGGIHLTSPTSGHLPLLRHLCVNAGAWDSERDKPSRLLQSLLPLLPLPSLLTLNRGAPEGNTETDLHLRFEVGLRESAAAAAEAAALGRIAHILAAAPQLQLQDEVHFTCSTMREWRLSFVQVADSLRPLAGRFACVSIGDVALAGVQWAPLQELLPGLLQLKLHECAVGRLELACVVRQLAALRRLVLVHCTGGDGQALGEAVWAGLVADCPRPLRVCVVPALPAHVVAECEALRGPVPGRQLITWE